MGGRARQRPEDAAAQTSAAAPDTWRFAGVQAEASGDHGADEAALRHSQKMEAIGQLTGGIAHDFNNLLTGIIGSLDLMQRRLAQGRYSDVERLATAASTAAGRAAALTHRLLAFSRKQPDDLRVVQVDRLLAAMEDLLRRTLSESIELELKMPPGVRRTQVDPSRLESAILNLVINARDAMLGGGTLGVATANVTVEPGDAGWWGAAAGPYVAISVSDTGAGMPEAVVARAFEPFFTTKPPGLGTGLGLPMVYAFANQSGGAVKIQSELGVGTTVTLLLPQHAGEATDEASETRDTDGRLEGEGRVVLVVEDEQSVRALVMEVLQEHGYRGISATDGVSGLQILETETAIDLLISDVGLPGLSGPSMLDAARKRRPALPVLFITGYAPDHALRRGIDSGAVGVLPKPFTIDDLLGEIRARLRRGGGA